MQRMPISSNEASPLLVQVFLAKDIFGNMFADPFFVFLETVGDNDI